MLQSYYSLILTQMVMPERDPEQSREAAAATDTAMHTELLGDDELPPELLERVAERARAMGLDPEAIGLR